MLQDFPGGPVVKNLPSNAGDAGSIPGQETKIPHALGQLILRGNYWACMPQLDSSLATTTEPMCSGARVPQLESPRTTTKYPQQRSCVPQLRPDTAKQINK